MTDEEQKHIFSKNLNYYINCCGKQQKEVAKDLGISPTTFNTWCVGKIIPSMGKIQRIADYFKIGKSDLLEDHSIEHDPELDFQIMYNKDIQDISKKYLKLNDIQKEMLKNYLNYLISDYNK